MSYLTNTEMHIKENGGLSHERQLDLARTCDEIEAYNKELLAEMKRIKDAYVPPLQLTTRIRNLEELLYKVTDVVNEFWEENE